MPGTAEHILHGILVHLVETATHDDGDPHAGNQEDDDPVQDSQGGDHGHRDEPEPEEDVDLLVDDVEGEDAEAVVPGDGAGGAVLVEGALGHLWLK